ncbi:MAG TPA: Holliday junction branch migration DNA helicase RuvB [Candidatus Binataceae bacterium]|jgi:Holliday junction DNA helicase RuvB|nr:Holliday junction branch migration DNA helicase RuvB [Candidatus Binataceae bacterium]
MNHADDDLQPDAILERLKGAAEASKKRADKNRVASPSADVAEQQIDLSLRPRSLAEFIGQQRIRKVLGIAIAAARGRNEVLDHVLFSGPPGLGKTSLAHIIARELGVNLRATSGPAIERAGDLAAIVNDLDRGDVLFIDEIHRLSRVVEEILYPAMEDFELNIVVGKGPGARTMRLAVKPFTLVGATTRSGLLSSPLRDRFGQHYHLDFYSRAELTEIVRRSAGLLKVRLDDDGAAELAARSRGTPRIANRLLRRIRDYAQINHAAVVTREVALGALELLEVDGFGFDRMDRAILSALIEKFNGGPVGIESLAAAVGEEADTIGEVYEPYLLQEGFIARTNRGRVATQRAYDHLGVKRRGTLL